MKHYWKLQLAGWLGYSAVGITINLLNGGALGPLLAGHVVLVSCGIGLTHLLRREIHRRGGFQWGFLAAACFGISLVLAGGVIGMNRLLTGNAWGITAVVALWWGMLLAVGVWMILYVRFSERKRAEQLQHALRESQLLALEAQLNPHFLFNALNSIRALVEIEPVRAQDMLTRLGSVLRHTLRRDVAHTIPLEEEMGAVSDYLALEGVRFGQRLDARLQVAEQAAGELVPPMIVQTLVENAIKHGVGQTRERVTIGVHAERHEGALVIRVENTGRLGNGRGGLGLKNTAERLKLLYGEQGRVKLEELDGRVVATATIPAGSYAQESHSH